MSTLFAVFQLGQHLIDLSQLFWRWLFSLDGFGMRGPLWQFFADLSTTRLGTLNRLRLRLIQLALIVAQCLEHVWYQLRRFLCRVLAHVLDVPFQSRLAETIDKTVIGWVQAR